MLHQNKHDWGHTVGILREKQGCFARLPNENSQLDEGGGSPASPRRREYTCWSCWKFGHGVVLPCETGSKVTKLEILSPSDFLQDGSLQTLQNPPMLFYKLTFVLKWKARPEHPWAAAVTAGHQPPGGAVGSTSPGPNANGGRELRAEGMPPPASLEWNKAKISAATETSCSHSPLQSFFQDASQTQVLSGFWPNEIKHILIQKFANLALTSKTCALGPHLYCLKLFSMRLFVKSVYQTLHSHRIMQQLGAFKDKVH